MFGRFYLDLAKAHITELQEEADGDRLSRCRGAKARNFSRSLQHLAPWLRGFVHSHRFSSRRRPSRRSNGDATSPSGLLTLEHGFEATGHPCRERSSQCLVGSSSDNS